MGRDSTVICRTCGVYQQSGYGSYSTWMDEYLTVAEFDAAAKKYPDDAARGKNQNHRAFLVRHDGHKIEFTSEDFDLYENRNPREGLSPDPAPMPHPDA